MSHYIWPIPLSLGTVETATFKVLACVASVSVLSRSKERPRNGILGFSRARNETRAKKWKRGMGVGTFFARSLTFETARKRLLRRLLRSRPHLSWYFLENGDFFLRFGLSSTRKRNFREPKTQIFENGSHREVSWKRQLIVFVGTHEKEVFKYDNVIHHKAHPQWEMLPHFHVLAFSCGQAKLIQISYVRTRIFFENGEGKSPDTSGRGLTDSFVVSELQEITASSSLPVCLRFLVFSRPMPRKRPQGSQAMQRFITTR